MNDILLEDHDRDWQNVRRRKSLSQYKNIRKQLVRRSGLIEGLRVFEEK